MHLTGLIVICCLFPFLMTVLGAAAVFLCPRGICRWARQTFLGFAAGVMLAASVWSLLNPAIAAAQDLGWIGWVPASVGAALGVLFLFGSDIAISHLHAACGCSEHMSGNLLLQVAMTVHNIPEGMAVGLSVALAVDALSSQLGVSEVSSLVDILRKYGTDASAGAALSAAFALSLGIGIQNLPEGAAVSLPLRKDGTSGMRAFLQGCLSGAVEPVFGILTALVLSDAAAVMPWLLSFAAGAMLYVICEELIPGANDEDHGIPFIGTLSTAVGFLMMMILDVALG